MVIELATGLGKTIIFAQLPQQVKRSGKKTLVLAHRDELLQQAKDKILAISPELSVEIEQGGNKAEPDADVIIASVQTLGRKESKRIQKFNPGHFGLVIVDECHHSCSSSYLHILEYMGCYSKEGDELNKCPVLLGVTATPERHDGQGLDKVYQEIVFRYGLQEGVQNGYLAPIKAYTVRTNEDLSGIKLRNGDFAVEELAETVNCPVRNKIVVDAYTRLVKGEPAIAFAVDVQHSEDLAELFRQNKYTAQSVTGNTDTETRQQIMSDFRAGKLQVLVNCMVATEGFDCLDDKTEILTDVGWVGISNMEKASNCFSLNLEEGVIEIVPILARGKRPLKVSERMVEFKNQHYNLRVTEGHSIYIKGRTKGHVGKNWMCKSAKELVERLGVFALPMSGDYCSENSLGVLLSDEELRIIAWYITDGYLSKNNRALCVYQSCSSKYNKRYVVEIEELLVSLGWDYGKRVRYSGRTAYKKETIMMEFRIPKGTSRISTRMRTGYNSLEKYLKKELSEELMLMSPRQFLLFWKELLKGDGCGYKANGEKRSWLCTSNKLLVDRIQELAIRCGFATSVNLSKATITGKDIWYLTVREKKFLCTQARKVKDEGRHIAYSSVVKNENVWCMENKNKTLVVRREGKVSIIGNCPRIRAVLFARPTKSSVVYKQQAGRGTRLFAGKDHVKFIDFVDNMERYDLCSASTLIGLNQPIQANGEDLFSVKDKFEELLASNPMVNVFDVNINNIDKLIKEVNIFALAQLTTEVQKFSKYSWNKFMEGYRISLGAKDDERDFAEIRENMLGQYEAVFYSLKAIKPSFINGYSKTQRMDKFRATGADKVSALQKADSIIYSNFDDRINLVKQNAGWRSDGVTDKQKVLLIKFGHRESDVVKLTKGQASILLDKCFSERSRRKK